jgi:hypothetical protein
VNLKDLMDLVLLHQTDLVSQENQMDQMDQMDPIYQIHYYHFLMDQTVLVYLQLTIQENLSVLVAPVALVVLVVQMDRLNLCLLMIANSKNHSLISLHHCVVRLFCFLLLLIKFYLDPYILHDIFYTIYFNIISVN